VGLIFISEGSCDGEDWSNDAENHVASGYARTLMGNKQLPCITIIPKPRIARLKPSFQVYKKCHFSHNLR